MPVSIDAKRNRLKEVITEYADQLERFLVVTPESVRVGRNMKQGAA
jgi:hypothetical protein